MVALKARLTEWMATPDWSASQAFLTAHRADLLTPAAEAALNDLITQQPHNELLLMHDAILRAARRNGIASAYAPFLPDPDPTPAELPIAGLDLEIDEDIENRLACFSELLNTEDWESAYDYVCEYETILLDAVSLDVYAALLAATDDAHLHAVIEQSLGVLQRAQTDGIAAAFRPFGVG